MPCFPLLVSKKRDAWIVIYVFDVISHCTENSGCNTEPVASVYFGLYAGCLLFLFDKSRATNIFVTPNTIFHQSSSSGESHHFMRTDGHVESSRRCSLYNSA